MFFGFGRNMRDSEKDQVIAVRIELQSAQCRRAKSCALSLESIEAYGAQGSDPRLAGIELHLTGGKIVVRFYRLASVDGAANRRSGRHRLVIVAQNTPEYSNLGASRTHPVNQGPDSENM
jgi:hypothetical protein